MRRGLCICLFLSIASTPGQGQSQAPVRTAAAGVLIDVTVVDKKGQPVVDLTAEDFELTEEGKRQRIVSVQLVRAGIATPEVRPEAAPEIATPLAPPVGTTPAVDQIPTVTAILFDRLSPSAAPYAVRAALAYVDTLSGPHEYAGVFVADLHLRTSEPFTHDQTHLRAAIERFAVSATADMRPEKQRAGDLYIQKLDPNTSPTAGADERGGFASLAERERALASMDGPTRKMAEIVLRMENGFRQLLSEYEGQASVAGLGAVVHGLAALPGRKSILYFTEALPIADRLRPKFEALIGQANRANITFYPVDAAGLRLHSKEAELARNVNLAAAQGLGDAEREDGPWTRELERQDQLLVSRPTAVLGRLAKDTGGFVIENTNNLGAGVARMRHERTTYYLVGYHPANAIMDGKFRRVQVKVKRPKVEVRARPGYLAIPVPAR